MDMMMARRAHARGGPVPHAAAAATLPRAVLTVR